VRPEPPARAAEPVTAPGPTPGHEVRPRSTAAFATALGTGVLLGAWLRGRR
jgi:hypothetical protein